ncbi:methylated-DNA--[protein]-cysteine S-methyltransferase [Kitasatospora sp. NPDC056651]|uniref:methylated-DNA--[protein]-cysteine S-methyltransferase n=1 Tax=Kitasatospora sp. NPDC056651 TaxID=3345892 RepID=UPI0036CB3027
MDTTRHTVAGTRLGTITLVADGDAVTGLYFRHHVRRPDQQTFGPAVETAADPLPAEAAEQLHDYFDRRRTGFDLPLRTSGDDFRETVWAALRTIPYGTTTTYGRLAEQLGDPALAQKVGQAVGANPLCVFVPCHRAVGTACATNPLPVVVPCHRVLRTDGTLGGYIGGLDAKTTLLNLEATA